MRKLCPNFDKQNGLETVLEVPIPEEMFTSMGSNAALRWHNLRALMKAQSAADKSSLLSSGSNNEFMALLKLVGSPLIPLQVQPDALTRPIKVGSINGFIFNAGSFNGEIRSSTIFGATGGLAALNSINSMYAVGEVKMMASEMLQGDDSVRTKGKSEVGGFVLWQKNPDLWYLELVVSGFKVSAGSDGKVAWNQSSSQPSHANRGPPRPLRRIFQGLDLRCIANLFLDAVCIREQTINNEDCFVLRLETALNILKAQSTPQTEISRRTIWGYFSQRTGLIIQFEDTKLVRVKVARGNNDSVFWETRIVSEIEDYRYVEGINIAHSGKTCAMLYRYGEAHNHKRRIEEPWRIEEIDFNICGLSMGCFLPPADLKRDSVHEGGSQGAGES